MFKKTILFGAFLGSLISVQSSFCMEGRRGDSKEQKNTVSTTKLVVLGVGACALGFLTNYIYHRYTAQTPPTTPEPEIKKEKNYETIQDFLAANEPHQEPSLISAFEETALIQLAIENIHRDRVLVAIIEKLNQPQCSNGAHQCAAWLQEIIDAHNAPVSGPVAWLGRTRKVHCLRTEVKAKLKSYLAQLHTEATQQTN